DAAGTIADEIGLLAEFGLDPTTALQAATTSAYEFLQVDPAHPGEPATLVTYDDDPRDDPRILGSPPAGVIGGRPLISASTSSPAGGESAQGAGRPRSSPAAHSSSSFRASSRSMGPRSNRSSSRYSRAFPTIGPGGRPRCSMISLPSSGGRSSRRFSCSSRVASRTSNSSCCAAR